MHNIDFNPLAILAQCTPIIVQNQGLAVSMLMAGFVGGFSHCMVMCGPFVVSQAGDMSKVRGAFLWPYHFGRMTTYVVMAVLLSSVLNIAFLFLPVRSYIVAPVLLLAALVFLINAFPSLGKIFPWAATLSFTTPYNFMQRHFAKFLNGHTMASRYALGLMLGFMPCGLVASALMAASTAPSPVQAAVAMGAFAVGTMPALIVAAFGGRAMQNKYPWLLRPLTRGMMIISAAWLITIAVMLVV